MENTTKEQLVDTYVANIELNVELEAMISETLEEGVN